MVAEALVTGGSGFIGSHLVDRLAADGWRVRNLDLRPPHPGSLADWTAGDVRDAALVARVAKGASVVFHLGALVGVDRYLTDPVEVIDVTIAGTRAVLEAASAAGASLIHLSSSEVLGINPDLPWAEHADRVLGPTTVDRWCYGSAKGTAEHLVIGWSRTRGLPVTVLRPFNVYGPRQLPTFVVPAMIRAVLADEPVMLHDGGHQTRCFTYVDDAVEAIAVAGRTAAIGDVLHIGSTAEISIRDLVGRIEESTGRTARIREVARTLEWAGRYQDVPRRVPDVSDALASLGWKATTSLDEGLRATVAWAREHPGWGGLEADETIGALASEPARGER